MKTVHSILVDGELYSDSVRDGYESWLRAVNARQGEVPLRKMKMRHVSLAHTAGHNGHFEIVRQVFDLAWERYQVTSPLAFISITAAGKLGNYACAVGFYFKTVKAHPKEDRIYSALIAAAFFANDFVRAENVKNAALMSPVLRNKGAVLEAFGKGYAYKLVGLKSLCFYRHVDDAMSLWTKGLSLKEVTVDWHMMVLGMLDYPRNLPDLLAVYNTALKRKEVSAAFFKKIIVLAIQYEDRGLSDHAYQSAKSIGLVDVRFVTSLVAMHESHGQQFVVKPLLLRVFEEIPGCKSSVGLRFKASQYGVVLPDCASSGFNFRLFASPLMPCDKRGSCVPQTVGPEDGRSVSKDLLGAEFLAELGSVERPAGLTYG
ncbi:MAG: hypothetical protein P1U34_08490 [Coxiellaceae bacterium]|nr:hypothetical protein [Coxiellaceae bacterium]